MSVPKIPGYRIETLIGKGACGAVYAARHESGGLVAVKLLNGESCNPAIIANQVGRLYRSECPEGALPLVAHSLQKAPLLMLGALEADPVEQEIGNSYEPRNLQMRLDKYLGRQSSWGFVLKLGAALAEFHRRRVAHGNLKPGNIFIGSEGQPLLVDFAQGLMPGIRTLPYTDALLYAPPEQLTDPDAYLEGAGYGWDVHAFGVLAFRLLNGIFPRCNETFAKVSPAAGEARRKGVEADCQRLAKKLSRSSLAPWPEEPTSPEDEARREILEKCLHLDPWERYADMREVMQTIAAIGTKPQVQVGLPKLDENVEVEVKRKARWRGVAGLGMAATIALGGVAAHLLQERNKAEQDFLNLITEQNSKLIAIERETVDKIRAIEAAARRAEMEKQRLEEGSDHLRSRFVAMGQDLAGMYQLSDVMLGWVLESGATGLPPLDGGKGRLAMMETTLKDLLLKCAERPELARQQWRMELALAEVYLAGGKKDEGRSQLELAVSHAPKTGSDAMERVARARVMVCLLASEEDPGDVGAGDLAVARKAVEKLRPGTSKRDRLLAALGLVEARGLQEAGDVDGALEKYRVAFDAINRLCEAQPANRTLREWRVGGLAEAANLADGAGVVDAALQLRRQTAAELIALLDENPSDPGIKIELSGALGAISEAALEAGDTLLAKEHALRGKRLIDEVVEAEAATGDALVQLAGHKSVIAACDHSVGDSDKAMEMVEEGLGHVDEAMKMAQSSPLATFRKAMLKWQKASLLGFAGRGGDELKVGREARDELGALLKANSKYPSVRQVRRALAYLTGDLGVSAQTAGNNGEAVGYFRECAGHWEALVTIEKDNEEFREGLDWAKERLGELGVLSAATD